MTLEERAEQIAREIEPDTILYDGSVQFDPATIAIILAILVEVVQLFMKCHSASGATAQLADPGFFHKLLMRRAIKKQMKRTHLRGREDQVEAAIIRNGKSVSTQEMTGYYAEVGG